MRRYLVLGFMLLCAAMLASPAHAQQDSARVADPPLIPAIVGGTLGSVAGAIGGGGLAYAVTDCDGDSYDVCEGIAVSFGAIIGSTLGAALGAHMGARLAGTRPSFGRTLLASTGGLLVGAGAALLLTSVDDGPAFVVAFAVTQGTIAGLGAALWQREQQ